MNDSIIEARNRVASHYGEDVAQDVVVVMLKKINLGQLQLTGNDLNYWALNCAKWIRNRQVKREAKLYGQNGNNHELIDPASDMETRADLSRLLASKDGKKIVQYLSMEKKNNSVHQRVYLLRKRLKEKLTHQSCAHRKGE